MPPVTVSKPIGFTADERPVLGVPLAPDGSVATTYAEFFKAINQIEAERGEWCGLPVPLKGLGLVLEDRHPRAKDIDGLQRIMDGNAEAPSFSCSNDDLGLTIVNSWKTARYRGDIRGEVVVIRDAAGRTSHGFLPSAPKRNGMLLGPFETFEAWTIEAEVKALEKLRSLVSERIWSMYFLTGAFLETSKRSGVTYMFRKLRPTIAMTPRGSRSTCFKPIADAAEPGGEMRILACLCLHPVAYYAKTFCGAMCPTDDVIAHLLMARGDEHLFWKRAVHHHPEEPESGL